ncbi:MAG: nucleotidyltransferase domain-containing protein [Nitrospirae bacterium]|nr:nucleotidyltransferase domain-containing protein [Nitrospirota bacterium]
MKKIFEIDRELFPLIGVLKKLREEGKILIAVLYGSYAAGIPHRRSDIDLALYINARDENDEIGIIDRVLMSLEKEISILRLNDDDESPFVIQEALKGINLVDPDKDTFYSLAHKVLHETEAIRFKRAVHA